MKLEVGAKIRKSPMGFICANDYRSELYKKVQGMEGTVVYVNFAHRYFTVEYEFKNGMKFLESFKMMPPTSKMTKGGKYD